MIHSMHMNAHNWQIYRDGKYTSGLVVRAQGMRVWALTANMYKIKRKKMF